MTTLIERQEVVLLAQARQRGVPHRLIRHQRVDKDEPRRFLVAEAFGDLDVERDALFDLDVVCRLLRLGKGKHVGRDVAYIERDEEARHHVVGRGHGGTFDELLVAVQVGFQIINAALRDRDVER